MIFPGYINLLGKIFWSLSPAPEGLIQFLTAKI